ncbi:MAG TPA: PIN domain nuclease [Chloroflexota bacterium]|jgi:predicted nucleic acid-binding protein
MILADTSAWIEYDRSTGSPVHLRLRELLLARTELAVTEPVLMEVLIGARTDQREASLRDMMLNFEVLHFDVETDFDGAVRIYRRCRAAGVTPRGVVDCMIAAVAWREGASLLASDVDMNRIASVIGIDLDEASRSA